MSSGPPPRPPRWEEALATRLFSWLAPRLPATGVPAPPAALAPYERVAIPRRPVAAAGGDRRAGDGAVDALDGTWYPPSADRPPAGGVLFLHPWLEWGESYFHRRGRLAAVRRAGYAALTFNLPGFGASGPPRGFYDRAAAAALVELARRLPEGPLHVWGVSSGGYWMHPVLSGRSGLEGSPIGRGEEGGGGALLAAALERIGGAFFEDVSPHLLEWSGRTSPHHWPAHAIFRNVTRASYRFLDLRAHAPHLAPRAVAYASGAEDPGIRPEETRELARLAGGEALVVPRAKHLAAIKLATSEVLDLALGTFRRGEAVASAKARPRPRLKDLLLAETPKAEVPVPSRRRSTRRHPGSRD